jgi:formamidopyrimidine-DNA glycosylase
MPEGPEVTIIANSLNSLLKDKYLVDIEFTSKSRYMKKKPDGFINFNEELESNNKCLKITKIVNKGKFIYWKFKNGYYMMQTLGLSGGWFTEEPQQTGCIIYYKDWSTNDNEIDKLNIKKLYYNDQRRFGTLKFTNDKKVIQAKLKSIGPDILNESITMKEWFSIFRKKKLEDKLISRVLLNQSILSGIGNYLRAEILYNSKISPHRLVKSLTDKELILLYRKSLECIKDSYNNGGTSIRHYSDIDGKKGVYGYRLNVYGNSKDPYGNQVKREKIGNDTQNIYWVPAIQK